MARGQNTQETEVEVTVDSQEVPAEKAPREPHRWSDEQKENMRQKMTEYYKTHEHPNKGKPWTEEQKEAARARRAAQVAGNVPADRS
jgi:hypothetical protein